MGTVDCQQGMEGWYDAAVCGLVREVVGVYSVSSIMCVPEIGIRPLETQGGVVYYFSCSSIRIAEHSLVRYSRKVGRCMHPS